MTSNTAKQKKLDTLAAQTYGSGTTIGPRQVSIIADIYLAHQMGLRANVEALAIRHPGAYFESAIRKLRARKLVKGHRSNLRLTPAAMNVGRNVDRSALVAGLGLVAIGAPAIR